MPLRVIAGDTRGRRLRTPPGRAARPTLDRVREAVFSSLTPRLPGVRFCDLFAGSGANGVEALSRGAAYAAFADDNAQAIAVIRANLDALGYAAQARLHRLTLPTGLTRLAAREEAPFGVIYADPPFAFAEYGMLLHTICGQGLLAPGGLVVVEHAARTQLPAGPPQLTCEKRAVYGETAVSFFLDRA